ncbi:peptidase inhibitor family I36 protein [Amycolatopsis sp. QT-25]|uniref:peptidase inhibitor family I36 protein n=1 Tax=Amycolatopsis sp. QT-25 TaxID=3034022 RepID=UPI0023EA8400|nr:peptidase inhibitor family I36 protein [Amycolatopsis sp. QT-25]WET82570.1 peptidase inhibitor family I36 protein [Amycolatopsis sp. QT-25]
MSKFSYRVARVMTVMAGCVVMVMGLTSVASAAPAARNGRCEDGEFCLNYNLNLSGAVSDFVTSIRNYGSTQPTCYEFIGPGAGAGQCLKNKAKSAQNRSSRPVTVYFNSDYGGDSEGFAPGAARNLKPALRNNVASHRFG